MYAFNMMEFLIDKNLSSSEDTFSEQLNMYTKV